MTNPYAAYKTAQKTTLSPRQIQSRILRQSSATFRLLKENWDEGELLIALKANLEFWTAVQQDALADDCPLPNDLRINLLRLSSYVDKRTMEIITEPHESKLDILISININLAEGLDGNP